MTASLLAAVCLLTAAAPTAAEALKVLPAEVDGVAPGQMMHEYLLGRCYAALDRRDAEYEKIKTPDDIAAYQKRMWDFFVEKIGGFPERTPLNARVVASQDHDGYRTEKIIFESRPRHFVTGVLHLPKAKPPYPGVLVPCGHSHNGKAATHYQQMSILLARNGMAAFCYDPIDQGERQQLVDADGKPLVRYCTSAHCLVGVGSILVGRNTAQYRIWDGMRAIDYLQSRPEVDPQRIGCTGHSGGGTMTSYLMALDKRIFSAAPNCYLTSMRRLLEKSGPQDAEQNIHGQVAFGMGHADYVMMRAPRPTLMGTTTHDGFNIGGAWESFRQAKRLYTRLDFAERVTLIEVDAPHSYRRASRVPITRWMRRWLLRIDDAVTEPEDVPVMTDEEIQCTPRGQVMLLPGARNCYDFTIDLEKQLAEARKKFWQETGRSDALDEVRRIAGIRKLADLAEPKCEKTGTLQRDGYRVDKLILRPEPGICLPALAFVPAKPTGQATLYVNAAGKQADAGSGGPIEKLVGRGRLVLAVDLRGSGETERTIVKRYGEIAHYMGPEWREIFMAYLLDTSYLAMRAEDVLVCARFLSRYESGGKANVVHLVSIGRVGPAALHAAVLEPELFASVALRNCLVSWSNVVNTPLGRNQLINAIHGALKTYDLPDLTATLPKEKLTVTEPFSALEQPLGSPQDKPQPSPFLDRK